AVRRRPRLARAPLRPRRAGPRRLRRRLPSGGDGPRHRDPARAVTVAPGGPPMSRHATTLAAAIALILAATAQAQNPMPTLRRAAAPAAAKPPAPIRTTMQALHAAGGVPKGWKFLMPPGDPARGRDAFVALACFAS